MMLVSGLVNPWTQPFAERDHRINSFSMKVVLTSLNLSLGGKQPQTLSFSVSSSVKAILTLTSLKSLCAK